MYCSLFPRGWYFCGVSNVCSLLYPGHFIIQVSCLQRFSLPVVSSVCSLDWMWPLLSRCALVFLWNKTCYHYCQNWGAAKLPGQKTGQVRAWASLLRKEDCHVDWDQYGWNKSSSSSVWWGRALRRQVRWQKFALPWFPQMVMCLCWGTGEGNSTFQFLCSWRGSFHECCSQVHPLRWANNLLTVCPRHSSNRCFYAVCPWAISPTFSPRVVLMLSGLYPSKVSWLLKF